jgi:hypothetical protein
MWSTCAILLSTPIAFLASAYGLVFEQSKLFAAGGVAISGVLGAMLILSMFGVRM